MCFVYHICPESFWKNYRTWGIGIAYKPCLVRGRNHYGNLRIGASGGSDTDKFIAGIHAGYEHNLSLRHGWGLYIQVKCDLIVPDQKDLFRTGIVIGFKIPTSKDKEDEDISHHLCRFHGGNHSIM